MPKQYPAEARERAVRMVLDRLTDYPSVWSAAQALGPKLDIGPETLREWVLQAQIDGGQRSGPSSDELAEIKRLRAENRDLKEANEILRAASIFFARELCATRRRVDRGRARDPAAGRRSSWVKPGGSLIRGTPVRVASGPDGRGTCWHCQTVRARAARPEGATRVNQCLTLRNIEAGSNLVDMGRCAVRDGAAEGRAVNS